MVLAPKMAEVVCAQNFFRRNRTKPILQVTVNKSKMKCPYAPHYYPLKEKQEPGYTLPNNNVPDKIEAEAWRLTVLQVVESLIKLSKV
jgi:hypothetical protein